VQVTRDFRVNLNAVHVSGSTNSLADFCSRSFALSDQEFLTALNAQYPLPTSWKLAQLTPDILQLDFDVIYHNVSQGISQQCAAAIDTTWDTWTAFCSALHVDPTLQQTPDPILPLQLFAHRYRRGDISPSKAQVRGKTVGDAL
jgi:hypothetical protein